MADGETTLLLKLTLSDPAARRLEAHARKLGTTPDELAAWLVEQQLFDPADYDWGDDPQNDPRTATVDYDESEPTIPAEKVLAEFRLELERRLAASR